MLNMMKAAHWPALTAARTEIGTPYVHNSVDFDSIQIRR